MSNFDELLRNNASFARTGAKDRVPEIPFIPDKQVFTQAAARLGANGPETPADIPSATKEGSP